MMIVESRSLSSILLLWSLALFHPAHDDSYCKTTQSTGCLYVASFSVFPVRPLRRSYWSAATADRRGRAEREIRTNDLTLSPACGALYMMTDDDDAVDDGDEAQSNDETTGDAEGALLAAELLKTIQERGIALEEDLEEEEDEDDEEDDEPEPNIPQGAINAFLGYETNPGVGGLAGNVSITDSELYSAVKERVLDTAGGFVEYVKGAAEDDDDDEEADDDEDAIMIGGTSSSASTTDTSQTPSYTPPETIPDPDLTAGEVVMLVLNALAHNDVPTPNRGVEILFGFSSPTSSMQSSSSSLTPAEYADFLRETEYKVLFCATTPPTIEKADYSLDGKRAFFTARLETLDDGPVPVNFILSNPKGVEDDACWLIESMLIRPSSMRRRRRR